MSDINKLGIELVKPLAEDDSEIQTMFFGKSGQLSKVIFATRMEKGITQSELAKLIGVDDKVIHRLEGGSVDMGDELYKKAFSALGLDYSDYVKK